jgi:protein subunit release factor A
MPEDNRQRINLVSRKDLDISYFIGSGKGGQKKQKTASGVQIIHRESGAIGRCSETRSQDQNKREAFKKMTQHARFKFWLARRLYEIQQQETLEETIERETQPEFLKLEIKNQNDQWIEVPNAYFETPPAKQESPV